MEIVIWALPFFEKSAVVVSLYRLCERLRFNGYPAFIAGPTANAADLDAPLIDEEAAKRLCAMGFAAPGHFLSYYKLFVKKIIKT